MRQLSHHLRNVGVAQNTLPFLSEGRDEEWFIVGSEAAFKDRSAFTKILNATCGRDPSERYCRTHEFLRVVKFDCDTPRLQPGQDCHNFVLADERRDNIQVAKEISVLEVYMPTGQEDDSAKFWTRVIQSRLASAQNVSHRHEADIIEHARRRIDKEVAAIYTAISSLLTHRNALSPISSLPAEVLARILHFHAANEPPPQWDTSKPLGWIRATHVCRFWRETAFQNPCLWSEITDRLGERWTDEMLARAKSAPISYSQLSYMITKPGHVVASRVIPHQLFRLRHLSIIDNTSAMSAIVKFMIDSPAPILESFQLLHQGVNEGPILLPAPFAGHSPVLHKLELFRVQIPWSSPFLRGLHHLTIRLVSTEAIPHNASVPEYYNQFYAALEQMPDLRTLCLANCLPQVARPRPAEPEYSIRLPRLKTLSLDSADTAQCVDVLTQVTIPQLCRISMNCDDFSPGQFGAIRDLVTAHTGMNTDHPPPLTIFLSIADNDKLAYIVNFWRTALSPRPVDICPEPDFSLRISGPDEDDLIILLLSALLRSLWIESIRTLIIDCDDISWKAFQWIEIFQRYTALENVRAYGHTAATFCDALRMPVNKAKTGQSKNDEDVKDVFLAKLKLVELRRVDFDSNDFDEEEDFHEQLKMWLALRQKAAGTLPTFALRGCSVSSDQVEELEELIEVDWDLVDEF